MSSYQVLARLELPGVKDDNISCTVSTLETGLSNVMSVVQIGEKVWREIHPRAPEDVCGFLDMMKKCIKRAHHDLGMAKKELQFLNLDPNQE